LTRHHAIHIARLLLWTAISTVIVTVFVFSPAIRLWLGL